LWARKYFGTNPYLVKKAEENGFTIEVVEFKEA
jgi:hypothetical protein